MIAGTIPLHQILKVAQSTGNHQQLSHREHAPLDGAGSQLAHTLYPAKSRGAIFDQQRIDSIGLFQRIADFIRVALGLDLQHFLPGFLAYAAIGCTAMILSSSRVFK